MEMNYTKLHNILHMSAFPRVCFISAAIALQIHHDKWFSPCTRIYLPSLFSYHFLAHQVLPFGPAPAISPTSSPLTAEHSRPSWTLHSYPLPCLQPMPTSPLLSQLLNAHATPYLLMVEEGMGIDWVYVGASTVKSWSRTGKGKRKGDK